MAEPKDANRSPQRTPAPRSPKEQDQFTEVRNERPERGTNREQDREDTAEEFGNVTNRTVDERGNVTNHSVDEHGNAREQRADSMSDEKKKAVNNAGFAGAGRTGVENRESDYPDAGHSPKDPGVGAGGTDYVGKGTGNAVDEGIVDTVSGGTTTGMYSTVGGATVGGITTDDTNIGGQGDIADRDTYAGEGRKVTPETSGKFSGPDYSVGGTGSGAASNDRGAHLDDLPTGTGSAQRGNQAGVPSPEEGTITGGTYGPGGTSIDANKAMRKAEEEERRINEGKSE